MALAPVPNKPGFFRDTESGQIIDINDFKGMDRIFPFEGRVLREGRLRPAFGEKWALKWWSILIYPRPEVIPISLIVTLTVNDYIVAEAPLFALAESLVRPQDVDLYKRIEAIEKELEIRNSKLEVCKPEELAHQLRRLLDHKHELRVEVRGPDENFSPLRQKVEIFELRLCGLRRGPVVE